MHHGLPEYERQRQAPFVVAFDELTDNLEKVAADPTFIPQYTTEVYDKDAPAGSDLLVHGQPVARKSLFWALEKALDWVSQILEGLDNYYLCRNVACRAFMPHTCWVKEEGHERYKCPFCMRDYQPWAERPTFMLPNKLLIASCNGDEDLARTMGMQPHEVRIWFVVWADTASAVLERRMQEITLKLDEDTRNLSDAEFEQFVINQVNRTSARIFFEKKYMPADSLEQVKALNAQGCKRKWEYEHLLEGFWAGTAPEFVKDVTPYYDNDDAITMWGYTRMLLMKEQQAK